jgi:hypothetical protein
MMPDKPKLWRLVRAQTVDGKYTVDNDELFEHPFRALADGATVKFKDRRTEEVHEKECLWLEDLITKQTMFIPLELLEQTE